MMKRYQHRLRAVQDTPACSGFSLVELMIAMVLGIIIIGGCISIFSGGIRSSNLNQTLSTLQSNARFALDMIGLDVRASGFLGCAAGDDTELTLSTSSAPTTDIQNTALAGAVIGSAGWTPSLPKDFTPPSSIGVPVVGTQALSVQYARFPGAALSSSMVNPSASLVMASALDAPVSAGDLMVVSNCIRADLFKVHTATGAATNRTIQPDNSLGHAYNVSTVYPQNTRVMHFASNIYYIGNTQRQTESGDKVFSLYRQSYPYTSTNPPLELIEGVDQMILEFGVRQSSGTLAYVQADESGYQAEAIETVRIGLLMTSLARIRDVDSSRVYYLAGRSVEPHSASSTSATYPADKRLRIPFNATFNVRNRSL